LYTEIFVRIRWRTFYEIFLGPRLCGFSAIDVDLRNVLAHISKHRDEIRTHLENSPRYREDFLFSSIAHSQYSKSKGCQKRGVVG
jgi:uncharacterized protein (DUF2225 family)